MRANVCVCSYARIHTCMYLGCKKYYMGYCVCVCVCVRGVCVYDEIF